MEGSKHTSGAATTVPGSPTVPSSAMVNPVSATTLSGPDEMSILSSSPVNSVLTASGNLKQPLAKVAHLFVVSFFVEQTLNDVGASSAVVVADSSLPALAGAIVDLSLSSVGVLEGGLLGYTTQAP